jgi:hypothetical protein
MYHLNAALTDFAIPDPEGAASTLPRLPVLERLLARADRHEAPVDWRRWALATAGLVAPAGDLPIARTLASVAGQVVAGDASWFVATPVRLVAGMSEVHFDVHGPLVLDAQVRAALVQRFGRDFGDGTLALVEAGPQLLLRVAGAVQVATQDPASLTGRSLADSAPRGADAGRLQRLSMELQMWLHAQPVMAVDGRSANGLWLWGGGAAPLAGAARWPVLACDDPFLQAAATGADATPERVLDVMCVADLVREGGTIADADRRWFEPLATRLRDGELAGAELHCAGRVYSLRHGQRWRAWRRVRPWWECFA